MCGTNIQCTIILILFLISIFPTVAYSGDKIDIYLARDLSRAERHLDEDEFINVEAWTMEDLEKLIYDGKLQDAKTISAVMAYKVAKDEGRIN